LANAPRWLIAAGVLVGFPIAGAAIGFISGAIMAAVYNLVARWTGGLQFGFDMSAEPEQLPA
jgi:hypothetical protein